MIKRISLFLAMVSLAMVFLAMVFFSFTPIYSQAQVDEFGYVVKPPSKESICPKTAIKGSLSDCLACHVVPDFALKEKSFGHNLVYPTHDMNIIFDKEGKPEAVFYMLSNINSDAIKEVLDYTYYHNLKKVIIEIHSPGGSLFGAWRIVGLFRSWIDRGMIIETHVNGFAASAGFLIFTSGSDGYRFVSPQAELMWHELMTFEMFKISTPSSQEEQARVLRHLQDTANEWLASKSHLTKDQLDEKVRKREFWLNGQEAVEMGFADGFLCNEGEK